MGNNKLNKSTSIKGIASVVVVAALLAGCGGAASPPTKQTSGAGPSGSAISLPGDGPVNVEIAIDRRSLLGASPALAGQYIAAAETAAGLPVSRGGTVSITVFGSVGVRPVLVYQTTLPSLSELGVAARDENTWSSEIGDALSVGVGLTPPPKPYVQELAALTAQPGADIARALRNELKAQPTGATAPTVILILTNGLVREHNLYLYAGLTSSQPVSRLAALIASQASVPVGTPRAAIVRIAPVGLTSGDGLGPILTRKLVDSWSIALRSLPITQPEVSPTL
jgi:hypothetical protein